MSNENPPGNLNLAYSAGQTLKERIYSLNYPNRQDINTKLILTSLAGLWGLRFHHHYYSYPDSRESTLADIIGFDVEKSKAPTRLGFHKLYRDHYRTFAAHTEYDGHNCESLIIPDVMDSCREGILTDAVVAMECELREKGTILNDHKTWSQIIQRDNLGITLDELKEVFIDGQLYAMFIIGYGFPKIGEGTLAAEYCKKMLDAY